VARKSRMMCMRRDRKGRSFFMLEAPTRCRYQVGADYKGGEALWGEG